MEQSEYKVRAYDMIYLVTCAIKGETPDKARAAGMDLAALFEVCQEHILTACAAYALESAGIRDHEFTQAKEKAIRKNILLDAERRNILSALEREQIWYMPLKGSLLKDWYPKLGMRQMSDNDILCDNTRQADIKRIMLEQGFTCKHYGESNDDAYFKPPVSNFEMHSALFSASSGAGLQSYFENVKDRLQKDEDRAYGYHFTPEDFYIYMTAHEYKHYTHGGTGVRSLIDVYVYMQKFGNVMDKAYLQAEFEKLGIREFEEQSRTLSMKLFSGEALSETETKMLDFCIFSGTYGTYDNKFRHLIEESDGSKRKYLLQRIFPPLEHYKEWYPWAYRHKFLIPVAWVYRPIRVLLFRRKKLSAELKHLKQKD